MIAVRPVNLRIGNLHDHMVSEIHFAGNSLVLHFGETGKTALAFSLQLEGLLGFVDRARSCSRSPRASCGRRPDLSVANWRRATVATRSR